MSVTLGDFQPFNDWTPDLNGEKYSSYPGIEDRPKFLIDETTNRRYFNESKLVVGFKCFLLTVATPFVHSIASIVHIAYRILKLVSLSPFWMKKEGEIQYNLKARLADAGADLLKITATPFAIIGLELAALYGVFSPYDGRKLYASIERATYGHFVLAPCFQPDPTCHAFGGSPNKCNVF